MSVLTTAVVVGSEGVPDLAGESVLSKADRVLTELHMSGARVGLTELSRNLDMPKATVYRLATELTGLGYLRKSAGGYQLGWRLYEMGQTVSEHAYLRAAAMPHLVDLRSDAQAIGVHLSVRRGPEVVYLERLAGRREMAILSSVAMRTTGLRTASGRLFSAYGEGTGTRDAGGGVQDQLAEIRARRWALEQGECVPGLKTYAVPVFVPGTDRMLASVSSSVTMGRKDDRRVVHLLWTVAAEIGRELVRSAADACIDLADEAS